MEGLWQAIQEQSLSNPQKVENQQRRMKRLEERQKERADLSYKEGIRRATLVMEQINQDWETLLY